MSALFSLDRAAASALIRSRPAPPAFGVEFVSALLDRDEDDAARVLDGWVREGIAVENEPGLYAISASAAAVKVHADRRTAEELDWRLLALMAVLADLDRDPDTPRFSAEYEIPVSSPFASPRDAMEWFESNRPPLLHLVNALFDSARYRPCAMLAEALLGLCGHGGYPQDQVQIATTALQALARSRFNGGLDAHRSDGGVRARDQAVATINLVLASAWCTLGEVPTALRAIDLADEHARALGTDRLLAEVHRCRANAYLAAGNLETAKSEALVSLDLADDMQDGLALYRGHWSLGNILAALGHHHEACDELDKAADGASNLGHAIPYARALTALGASMTAAGEPEDAISVLTTAEMALTRADAGSPAYLADVDLNMGRAWRAAGDPAGTEKHFRQAIERYRLARRYRLADDAEAERAQR